MSEESIGFDFIVFQEYRFRTIDISSRRSILIDLFQRLLEINVELNVEEKEIERERDKVTV